MKQKNIFIFLLLFIFAFAGSAAAHDMWIQPDAENFSVIQGHHDKYKTYEVSRLKAVYGYAFNGSKKRLRLHCSSGVCRVSRLGNLAALTAFLDNKYWMKTTAGWKNHNRREGLYILKSGRSFKYTKHIISWKPFLTKPLGSDLEIVPLSDPLKLSPGDTLRVMVYYKGNPVSPNNGRLRISSTSDAGKTHDLIEYKRDGPYTITIEGRKRNLIVAKYEISLGGTEVIWISASLGFFRVK